MSFNINQMLKNLVPTKEPEPVIVKPEIKQDVKKKNNFKHGINVLIKNSATYKGLTATVLEDEFIGKRSVLLTNKLHKDAFLIDRKIDTNLCVNDEFYYNNRLHKVIDILYERFNITFKSNLLLTDFSNLGIIYVNDLPQIIHIKSNMTFDIITKVKTVNDFICNFTNVLKMNPNFNIQTNTTINKLSSDLLISSQMEFYNIFIYYFFKLIHIYNQVEEFNLGFYNSEFINITKNGFCSLTNISSPIDIYIMLYDSIILPNIQTYNNWLNNSKVNNDIMYIEDFVKSFYNIKKSNVSSYVNFKYDDYIHYVNEVDIYTLAITHEDIPRLLSITNNSYSIIDLPYIISLEELYKQYTSIKNIKFIDNWSGNVQETIYKNLNIYLTDEIQPRLLVKQNSNTFKIVELNYKRSNDLLISMFRKLNQIKYINEKFNPNLKYTVLKGKYYLDKMIFENATVVIDKLKCKTLNPYNKIGNNYVNTLGIVKLAYYNIPENNTTVLVQLTDIKTFIESDEKQRYLQSNETCSFKILDTLNISDVELMCLNNQLKYKDDKIYKDNCKNLKFIDSLLFLQKDKFLIFDQNIQEIVPINQTIMISFIFHEKKLYPVLIEHIVPSSNFIIKDINVQPDINLLNLLNNISHKIKTNSLLFSESKQVDYNIVLQQFYIFTFNGSWSSVFQHNPEQLVVKEYIYDVNLTSTYKQIQLHKIDKNTSELQIDDYFYLDNSGKIENYNNLLETFKKNYEQDPKNSVNVEILINRRDEEIYKKTFNKMIREIKREIRKSYKLCKVVGILNKRVNLKLKEDIVSIPLRNLKRITLATINDKLVLVELFEINQNKECFISILDIQVDTDNPTELFNIYMKSIQAGSQVSQTPIQKLNCKDINLKLPYVYFVVNLYKNDFYQTPSNLLGLYAIHTSYEDEKYVYILPEEKYKSKEGDEKYYYIMRGVNRGSSGFMVDEIKQELTLFIPTLQKRIALNTQYINNQIKNIPFTIDDLFYYDIRLKNGTNVQINKITQDYIYGIQLVVDDISNNIKTIPIKFTLNDIDQYLTGFQLNITEEIIEDDAEFDDEHKNKDLTNTQIAYTEQDEYENKDNDNDNDNTEQELDSTNDDDKIDSTRNDDDDDDGSESKYLKFTYTKPDKITHEDKDVENYLQGFNDIERVEFIKELTADEKKIYVYIDKLLGMFKFKRAQLEMSIDKNQLLQSIMKCLEQIKKQYKEKTGNNVIERDVKLLTAMFVLYQILNTGNQEVILNPKKMKIKDKLIHYIDILQSNKFLSDLIGDIKHYQHYKKHNDKKYVLLIFFDDSWTNVFSNIESHKLYTLDKEVLFYNCIKYVMSFYNNEIPLEYDLDTTKIPLFVLKRQTNKQTKKPLLYNISIYQYLTSKFDLTNLTYTTNDTIMDIDIDRINIKYDIKYNNIIKTFDSKLDDKIKEYNEIVLQYSLLNKILEKPFKTENYIVKQILKLYKQKPKHIDRCKYELFPMYDKDFDTNLYLYIYDGLKAERKNGELFLSRLMNIINLEQDKIKKELLQKLIDELIPLYEEYFNKNINELLKEFNQKHNKFSILKNIKNDYKNGDFALKRVLLHIEENTNLLEILKHKTAELNDDIIYYKNWFVYLKKVQTLFYGYINSIYIQNKTEEEYELEYQQAMFKMQEKDKNLQKITQQIKNKY